MRWSPFLIGGGVCAAALVVVGAAAAVASLVKSDQATAGHAADVVSTVAVIAPGMLDGARAEIQSQTDTTLNMTFFDATNAQYTLNVTRPTADDIWTANTTESLGIVFGNSNPRYAGSATRRALALRPKI